MVWDTQTAKRHLKTNWSKPSSIIAFQGINKIYDFYEGVLSRIIIEKILSSFESYSLMREQKNGKNRRLEGFNMSTHLHNLYESDSFSIEELKDDNDNAKHILCVLNTFSKKAFCVLMWDRSAASGLRAIKNIFSLAGTYPDSLISDKGGETSATVIRDHLLSRGTHSFIATGLNKAASVESRGGRCQQINIFSTIRCSIRC